jgi:hypothetical protein
MAWAVKYFRADKVVSEFLGDIIWLYIIYIQPLLVASHSSLTWNNEDICIRHLCRIHSIPILGTEVTLEICIAVNLSPL